MISVVVPIFNEEENLPELRQRITTALDSIGDSWELICVNEGSRDRSLAMLREMHQQDPRIKLINLSRNFGHQPAVTAGIHHARGDCVILIDGDLQDPPEMIPEMVSTCSQLRRIQSQLSGVSSQWSGAPVVPLVWWHRR